MRVRACFADAPEATIMAISHFAPVP